MRDRVTRKVLEDALVLLADALNMNLEMDENGAGRVAVYIGDGVQPGRSLVKQITREYLSKRECLAWIEGMLTGLCDMEQYEYLRVDQVQKVWKNGPDACQFRATVYGQYWDHDGADLKHGYVYIEGRPIGVFRHGHGDWTVRNQS